MASNQQKMTFGWITQPVIPDGTSSKFRKLSYLDSIDETQQCLLDNIWSTRGDNQKFLRSLNSLSIYFHEQNIKQTREIFLSRSSGGVSLNPSLASSSNTNLSCEHCKTMPPRKILDDRCQQIKDEVTILRQQQLRATKEEHQLQVYLTSFAPLAKAEKKQSSPLDDGESVSVSFQKKASKILALPKTLSLLPESIPPEIVFDIQHLARQKGHYFQEFLFESLVNLASQTIPGLSITWDTLYYKNQDRVECPKIDPLCKEIPLERMDCKCNLIFSIPKACIDLTNFQDLSLTYKGEEVQITPMTLLDQGFLRQLIITSPEQTDRVTRKMAVCINNIFAKYGALRCQVSIRSKMPEWTNFGSIVPAQHVMYISANWPSNNFHDPIMLISHEFPTWICSQSIRKQIRHHLAYSIASHLGDVDEPLFGSIPKLICEDPIQKIRSIDFIQEVPFIFHTRYKKLVEYYHSWIDVHELSDQEDFAQDDGQDFWHNLSEEEMRNIDNMMEF
jgi:hypothetical protein